MDTKQKPMEPAATAIMTNRMPPTDSKRRVETPLFSSTWLALFLVLRRQWAQSRSD